jgi:hypothetical protein
MSTSNEVTSEVVSIGITEGDIILRAGEFKDVLERAAKLDGYDDVGLWMIHFTTYYASQFTAADRGDQALANDLMSASMKLERAAA